MTLGNWNGSRQKERSSFRMWRSPALNSICAEMARLTSRVMTSAEADVAQPEGHPKIYPLSPDGSSHILHCTLYLTGYIAD